MKELGKKYYSIKIVYIRNRNCVISVIPTKHKMGKVNHNATPQWKRPHLIFFAFHSISENL